MHRFRDFLKGMISNLLDGESKLSRPFLWAGTRSARVNITINGIPDGPTLFSNFSCTCIIYKYGRRRQVGYPWFNVLDKGGKAWIKTLNTQSDDLISLRNQLTKYPIPYQTYSVNAMQGFKAASKRFGSWPRAHEAALAPGMQT